MAISMISLLLSACGLQQNAEQKSSSWASAGASVLREASAPGTAANTENSVEGITSAIPDSYYDEVSDRNDSGSLEWFSYETQDYRGSSDNDRFTKYACVYLPAGYEESDLDTMYNILYLMHGWTGYAGEFFDNPEGDGHDPSPSYMYSVTHLKNVIDHMIANGDIEPLIIVTPTFYPDPGRSYMARDTFHLEFANDLMPALESHYHSYATYSEAMGPAEWEAELKATRDHRAFGGFSYGSFATWLEYQYNYEYIRYYLPMSGVNISARTAIDIARNGINTGKEFFIYAATGTIDGAYGQMSPFIDEIKKESELFSADHLRYCIRQNGAHDLSSVREYVYNALPQFFQEAQTGATEKMQISGSTKLSDVIANPLFEDFGRLLFPADRNYYSGDTLGNLPLTWYGRTDTDKTVEIVSRLQDRALAGEKVFYKIYTDEEIAADPSKADTGLFFFKGEPGAKFAICNAGGGMVFVGAMQDSFPHALELSKMGYNAFALIYRPGYDTAPADLARAIAFIHEHAEELEVDVTYYSLWGGSAGARMAAWLGSYRTSDFGEKEYPRPAAVIMQYTGLSEVYGNEPPTYACVGTTDGIASWRTMQRRIEAIRANGMDAEIEIFDGLGHGFGLGTGTVAEGWINNAVDFWEKQIVS